MTWYASQIFAQPRAEVIDAFREVTDLRDGLYHVPHLDEWQTEQEEVVGVLLRDEQIEEVTRIVRRGPALPPDGLLVVREIRDVDDERLSPDTVAWNRVGQGLRSHDVVLDPMSTFADAPEDWREAAPPHGFLCSLERISTSTRSVVAYYACDMWGGGVERSCGWVWDGARETSCFYRGIAGADEHGGESGGSDADMEGAYAIDRFGRRTIIGGDVLTLLLLHFGLLLKDGYFELHRRAFPWANYKLPSLGG